MTPTGKMACILYAVVGIPFTLIFLSALVQRLLAPTFKLLSSFIQKLPHMDNFQVVISQYHGTIPFSSKCYNSNRNPSKISSLSFYEQFSIFPVEENELWLILCISHNQIIFGTVDIILEI